MKIIQIISAVNGESPGAFESQLMGLGDDGGLYEYVMPRMARVYDKNHRLLGGEAKDFIQNGGLVKFHDGNTVGWQLICMSIDRPKLIPHSLDPTRNERQ